MPIHTTTGRLRLLCVGVVFVLLIRAAGAHAGSLSVAWDASLESDVTNYRISYGTQSGVYADSLDVGNRTAWTFTALTDGQIYYLVVQAESASGLSPYSQEVSGIVGSSAPPPCTFAVSPLAASASESGGAETVSVSTSTGCAWEASSNTSWLSVTAGASGSGSGTVSYAVAPNAGTQSRLGDLTIAEQIFTVTQAGASCSFSVSPTSASVEAEGATGSAAVATSTGCHWTPTSNAGWLVITGETSGSGNGNVSYAVAANTTSSTRMGALTIAGRPMTVTQSASATVTTYALTLLADDDGTCSTGLPSQDRMSITTRLDPGRTGRGKKSKKDEIFLTQSGTEDMQVIDGIACDGNAAQFALPPNGTNTTMYTVWVKAFGGLEATNSFTTCGMDPGDNTVYCSTEHTLRIRNRPHHRGVTGELTTITGDFDANPETPNETLSLFDDALYGYFWEYDGSGLRRVQLRFQSVY